jgi:hypothetical protein
MTSTSSMSLYLDRLSGWASEEPEINLVPVEGDEPSIFVVTYRDVFGEDTISGFTYGLSLVSHPEWRLARPELFISMDSDKSDWALAAGSVVKAGRGRERYREGDFFDFGGPISPDESEMSVLLLFLATDLDPEFAHIELPDGPVNFVQLYPMYESEIPLLEEKGPEEFLSAENVNFHDPRRPPLRTGD